MPTGLLFPLSHHVMGRVVWERVAWLYLKRWGGLPETVVYGTTPMQDSRARWARRVDLVHLVSLVFLVYLVSFVQPNKRDKPNKQAKQAHMRGWEWNQNWSRHSGGMREAYRDLAHMIHERFCYNRLPVRGTQTGRSAATTSLRPAGSPLGPSPYCWGQAPFFLAPVPV